MAACYLSTCVKVIETVEGQTACPDPVDLDEVALEVLTEARARVASNLEKKLKRMAPEQHQKRWKAPCKAPKAL